jgi:hypothetical protein
MRPPKKSTRRMITLRPTTEDLRLLDALENKLTADSREGLIYTRSDVFRIAIRLLAEREKIMVK